MGTHRRLNPALARTRSCQPKGHSGALAEWPLGRTAGMPPVPFIFLRHYCTETRGDLFCFLDAAKFFWTTIALAPSPVLDCRPHIRERWPSGLVATAAESRRRAASFRRDRPDSRSSWAASDRTHLPDIVATIEVSGRPIECAALLLLGADAVAGWPSAADHVRAGFLLNPSRPAAGRGRRWRRSGRRHYNRRRCWPPL